MTRKGGFAINKAMNKPIDNFELTPEETDTLFSDMDNGIQEMGDELGVGLTTLLDDEDSF